MAKQKDWWEEEQDCCLNCGESNYIPSKTPGICIECRTIGKVKSPPR